MAGAIGYIAIAEKIFGYSSYFKSIIRLKIPLKNNKYFELVNLMYFQNLIANYSFIKILMDELIEGIYFIRNKKGAIVLI